MTQPNLKTQALTLGRPRGRRPRFCGRTGLRRAESRSAFCTRSPLHGRISETTVERRHADAGRKIRKPKRRRCLGGASLKLVVDRDPAFRLAAVRWKKSREELLTVGQTSMMIVWQLESIRVAQCGMSLPVILKKAETAAAVLK